MHLKRKVDTSVLTYAYKKLRSSALVSSHMVPGISSHSPSSASVVGNRSSQALISFSGAQMDGEVIG